MLRTSILVGVLLSICSSAHSQSLATTTHVPSAISEKLHILSGLSTPSCGVATTEKEREAGYECMNSALAKNEAFKFIWRKREASAFLWLAWGGTKDGQVYEILKGEPVGSVKDLVAVKCSAFSITLGTKLHGSAHCEHP